MKTMTTAFLIADAVHPGPHACGVLATIVVATIAFLIFALIFAVPVLRGKATKRGCACAASEEALRVLDERERAKKEASRYDPETVDASDLPTVSPELAEYESKRRA